VSYIEKKQNEDKRDFGEFDRCKKTSREGQSRRRLELN